MSFINRAKEKTLAVKQNISGKIARLLSGHVELTALLTAESEVGRHIDAVSKDKITALALWVKWAETEADDLGKSVSQVQSLNDKITEAHTRFLEAHKEYIFILKDILGKKKVFDEIVKKAKNAEGKLERARQALDKHEKGKQGPDFITKKEQCEKQVSVAESENTTAQQEKDTAAIDTTNYVRINTKKALVHITRAYSTLYSTCAQVTAEQLALAENISDSGDVSVEVTTTLQTPEQPEAESE